MALTGDRRKDMFCRMKQALSTLALLFCIACGGDVFSTSPSTFASVDASSTGIVDAVTVEAFHEATPPFADAAHDSSTTILLDASGAKDASADTSPVLDASEEEAAPPTYCCLVQEFSSGHCEPNAVEPVGNWTCGDTSQSEMTCGIGARCFGVVDGCYGVVQYCQ
jgi:hypothetical protein